VRNRFVSDLTAELSELAFVARNQAGVVDLVSIRLPMLDICDGIHNILTIQWRTHSSLHGGSSCLVSPGEI
jgi:hypothetical protein